MTSTPPIVAAPRPLRAGSPWVLAAACALAGAAVFQAFGNGSRGYIDSASLFYWWGFQWFNPGSETEHGPMILALSAWLLWRNLRTDESRAVAADTPVPRAAAVALFGGLVLHGLGYAVEQARISILGLLVFTWGGLALGGGRRWGRAAAFPLAFLVFAIPVNALDSIGFYLRLWVIDAVHALAPLIGIEVVRNGTQLFSPDGSYQYDVAAACSGVRSLMALMALSLLTAYLNLRSNLLRAAAFALCFPLTYLGNIVRIGGIVVAGEWFGQRAGEWLHAWAGFVVFVVVLGGVLVAVRALARWDSAPGPAAPLGESAAVPGWRLPAAVIAMAVLTAWFTTRVDRWPVLGGAGVALAADGINPADLPAFLGTDWIGQSTPVTAVEREILPPDTGFARRVYVSTHDRQAQVFLSVVLSGRDRTSIHRPELCLVGQGWTLGTRTIETFERASGPPLRASVLQISRDVVDRSGRRETVPALFVYWFVGRDEVVATHGERLWRTALNRLRGRTDRWAYVVAQTLVLEGEEAARTRLEEVLSQTLPTLQPGL